MALFYPPVGISGAGASASTGTVVFSNSNGISFGMNALTMTAAHNAITTGALSNHSHGNPQLNLTNLSGTTASNSAGFTLSLSAAAAGGGVTLSGHNPYQGAVGALAAMSNASLLLYPIDVPAAFQYDRVVVPIHFSQATNSTLTVTNSMWWGFFTKNANSLSLAHSGSGSFSINGSGTASSGQNSGPRIVSFGNTTTIPAGNYYLGYVWRTTTAGANATLSNFVASFLNSSISGYIGSSSVTNQPYLAGQGVWTSTTAGMPDSLAFTNIRANSSAYQRPPIFHFTSGTT